jgi:tetratricopeptide (TPR) repeat protein
LRKFQGLSFLLIITMTWMELALVTDLGMCDCHESCNYGHYGNLYEERLWYDDIYNFLYCDCSSPQYPYYYDINAQPNNYSAPAQPDNYDLLASYQATSNNDTANFWLNEADKLYLAGSYEDAVASYAKAVKLNPSLSMGWLNMGNAFYLMNRYQESLDAYNAALKLEPQNANALHGKVQALSALNRTLEETVAQTSKT